MKPPPFAYHAPATVEETLGLLDGDDVRVLAGGQSLVQLLKFRRIRPAALVDINGVGRPRRHRGARRRPADRRPRAPAAAPGGRARRAPPAAAARGGAATSATPRRAGAARSAGRSRSARRGPSSRPPRSRSTRRSRCARAGGDREIPAREFFLGPNETALARGELVVAVRFPARAGRSGAACHEVSARYRDYARVAAAAVVDLDADGSCRSATRRDAADRGPPGPASTAPARCATAVASTACSKGSRRPTTSRPAARYRRRVAPVLAQRALRDAMANAQGEQAA